MFFHCHTLHNWPTDVVTGLSFGGGPDNQPIHFEAPTCDGSESRLVDCTFDTDDDCAKPEDVGIICQRSEGWFYHIYIYFFFLGGGGQDLNEYAIQIPFYKKTEFKALHSLDNSGTLGTANYCSGYFLC